MSADESKRSTDESVQETAAEAAEEAVNAAAEADAGSPEASTDSGDVTSEDVSVEELVAQLQESQAEVSRLKDAVLRAEAETQNVRRRAEKDVSAAHKYSQEKLLKELLAIKDNLERAMEAGAGIEDGPAKALLEGIELTDKSFSDLLVKSSVVELNPVGETFDPQQHQAMSMVPTGEQPPNTVLTVVQKGYMLNDRLLRPAMVIVSKAPDESESGGSIDETA